MCGYIQRDTSRPAIKKALENLGLSALEPGLYDEKGGIVRSYPSFGGIPKKLSGLIRYKDGSVMTGDAVWWFDCKPDGDDLVIGERTTFNARNLDSNFWKGAFRRHRGVVMATGFGESQKVDGKSIHYLMDGQDEVILLGAVFRDFENGQTSCAVITRPASDEFAKYHEKAMPLMLPNNKSVIEEWLDPEVLESDLVSALVNEPRVTPSLIITPVKTFKGADPAGKSTYIGMH